MVKAIIFDLNGVFVQGPKLSDRFEKELGIASKVFMPILREVMDAIRRPGAQDVYSYWQPYLAE